MQVETVNAHTGSSLTVTNTRQLEQEQRDLFWEHVGKTAGLSAIAAQKAVSERRVVSGSGYSFALYSGDDV